MYIGRFAPSPTGPLHAGSLVAALASWLDARAHGGRWLVRIEDVDSPRCPPGTAQTQMSQLSCFGLWPDEPPQIQSQRVSVYAAALRQLVAQGRVYPCRCSRKDIESALLARGWQPVRHGERPYPGTCRAQAQVGSKTSPDLTVAASQRPPAWRLRSDHPDGSDAIVDWHDRRLGAQRQNVTKTVGDFVLRRADELWAYQLAVVVDDAAQGVTDVVRGEDLADNTPRQIHLQRALGLPTPRYLHTPLVLAEDGQKLSKQNGAQALALTDPIAALNTAAHALGLPVAELPRCGLADWLAAATQAWARSDWGVACGRDLVA